MLNLYNLDKSYPVLVVIDSTNVFGRKLLDNAFNLICFDQISYGKIKSSMRETLQNYVKKYLVNERNIVWL